MQPRLSPDFKTHRVSGFKEEHRCQQTLVINSQRTVDDLLPNSIKESPSFNRQLLKHLSGEASEVLSINAPSMRNELKSTRQLNRSNVSIVNQLFRNQALPQPASSRREDSLAGSPEKEKESFRTILDRKDLEVNFFKQQMDKLRQQARVDRANIQNLQEALKQAKSHDNSTLEREKQALQQRLNHVEREMEQLQRDMAEKSRITLTLSSLSNGSKAIEVLQQEKELLQKEITTLMRREIELQNELEYFRTKSISFEKQLSDFQNNRNEELDGYKREVIYELNILSNLNQSLVKENDYMKNTTKHLQTQNKELESMLKQTRLQLAEASLKEEKKLVAVESDLRAAKRAVQEKQFELTIMEGELRNLSNNHSAAQMDKENVIVQLQEQLRQASTAISNLSQENSGLTRQNTDLHLQLNEVRMKYQDIESKSRLIEVEHSQLLQASRTLQNLDGERRLQDENILNLSSQLQEHKIMLRVREERITELSIKLQAKEDEGKVVESDFARIQSEISLIKSHLKGEIDQLNREKQILQDSNRQLRLQMQAEVGNNNMMIQTLNGRLQDREKRLAMLQHQLNSRISNDEASKTSLSNDLEQARAMLRREQLNSQNIQTKLAEQQSRAQQFLREKTELSKDNGKLRSDIKKQQQQRQRDGHQLSQVVQELKREIAELEQKSKYNSQQAHSRYMSQLNEKTTELSSLREQQQRLNAKLDQQQAMLRERQLEIGQLQRRISHTQETETSLKLREMQLHKLRQHQSEAEELRRIVEEQRQQIKHLEVQTLEKLNTNDHRHAELEHFERIFQLKQSKISQIIRDNMSRLVQHKGYEQMNGGDRRQLLLNQFVEIVESLLEELHNIKLYTKNLEGEHRKKLEQLDKVQVELNSTEYEKTHLVNELESMVGRLKYVENYAQYLAGLTKSSDAEGKRLKSLNSSLKGKLEKELNERQWLQNRVKQIGESALVSPRIERAKQQRVQIFNMMREVIDVNNVDKHS